MPHQHPDRRWPLNVSGDSIPGDNIPGDSATVFVPLPRRAVEAVAGGDSEAPRYVIHLPVVAADLATALDLAASLARSLTFLPQIEVGDTTVSEEGRPDVRRRVFCDRLLPDRRRCAKRAGHDGPCVADG